MNVMKAKPGTLRKINERRIMNAIRIHGTMSRTDVQRELQLALPTVSRIVDSLIEMNWLEETGILETSMGRPPVMVRIKPDGAFAIGVDIGRTVTRIVYLSLLGRVVHEVQVDTAEVDTPTRLVDFLEAEMEQNGGDRNIIGVGIAAPGSPNPHPAEPRMETDLRPDHHWHQERLAEWIEKRLRLPAWVENDANAAVLGERWFGAGQSARHLLFVLSDAGVGAGVAVNGSIYHGQNNSAGEFAHTIVDIHGDVVCGCSRRGCMGGVAPMMAVLAAVHHATGSMPASVREVILKAKDGVQPEADIIAKSLDYLAAGVMNMVQVLDPTMVVLGGATFLEDPFMVQGAARRIERLIAPKMVSITVTQFGHNAVAAGAATLALQRVYDHTQLIDDPLYSQDLSLATRM